MKLLEISHRGTVYKCHSSKEINIADGNGFTLLLDHEEIKGFMFSEEFTLFRGPYSDFGELEVVSYSRWSDIEGDKYSIRALDNTLLNLSEIDREIFLDVAFYGRNKGNLTTTLSDGTCHTLVYSISHGCLMDFHSFCDNDEGEFYDGVFYVIRGDMGTQSLLAHKENLSESLWAFSSKKTEFSKALEGYQILKYEDTIIASIGYDQKKESRFSSRAIDASVCSIDVLTGELVWEFVYKDRLYNIALLDENRVVAQANNHIVLFSPKNGNLIDVIPAGFPEECEQGKKLSFQSSMWLTDEFIVMTAFGSLDSIDTIKFFDRNSLELVREENLGRHDIRINGSYNRPFRVEGDLLFLAVSRKDYGLFLDNLLVIDLSNIESPLEYEAFPSIDVQLPSDLDGSLRLTIFDAAWEDIVRFGERKLVMELKRVGKGYIDEQANPFFNGNVIFTVVRSTSDQDVLRRKLSMMKARLEYYIQARENEVDSLHDNRVSLDFVVS